MKGLKVAQEQLLSFNLKNKNVLVIGGTSGIGEAIVRRFSFLGASVIISGRNEKNGKRK
jgi:NAD(P)-dependent dehydrogenase (short-subunit alcohol dehydrogenase family)